MNRCLALLAIVGMAAASSARAAERPSCGHCGCGQHVRKVCRIVCDIEEVKEITYCCEAEDFCVPGPSKKCGCKEICTCGKVRTRHKLVKKEVVKKVPKYKCMVEYLCPTCCDQCGSAPLPAASGQRGPIDGSAPAAAQEFAHPAMRSNVSEGFSLFAPVTVEPPPARLPVAHRAR